MSIPERQNVALEQGNEVSSAAARRRKQGAAPRTGQLARKRPSPKTPLRELLAAYDGEVEESLREALSSASGTGRVRLLHNRLSRSVAVHDAVLESALCPLLDELPGGRPVADRLRRGCRERADLLDRFGSVSRGVAAPNVYSVSREEVERILEGLERSFTSHIEDETTEVGDVMESAASSADPDVLGALMAVEAKRSPTRVHSVILKHPKARLLKSIYRSLDRGVEWSDAHHGWNEPGEVRDPPRTAQVDELMHQALASPPSIRGLLAGYDATIDATIDELGGARGGRERAEAAHRLTAAIVIHDSVVAGALCPLLQEVSGGEPLARQLRDDCRGRADLLRAWRALTGDLQMDELYELHQAEADRILRPLIESFEAHEREGTMEVASLLEHVPDESYRTRAALLEDSMWPWRGEGPSLLALHMALWARSAPTRVHPLLVRHPSSRLLRTLFHLIDHFRDYWNDAVIERWLFPGLPSRPYSKRRGGAGRPGSGSGGRPSVGSPQRRDS